MTKPIAWQGLTNDQKTLQRALLDPSHPEYARMYGEGDLSFLNSRVAPSSQKAWTAERQVAIRQGVMLDSVTVKGKQDMLQVAETVLKGLRWLYEQSEAQSPGSGPSTVAAAYRDSIIELKAHTGMQNIDLPESIDGTPETFARLAAHLNNARGYWAAVASAKRQAGGEAPCAN